MKKVEPSSDEEKAAGLMCGNCGKRPAAEPHACPFQVEINHSKDESYCDCCEECRYQCSQDV